MNRAPAGDESVAVDHLLLHAEIARAMPHQLVHLLEGAFIEQQIDALPRRKLAFLVLPRAAFLAASRLGRGVAAAQFLQSVRHKRRYKSSAT